MTKGETAPTADPPHYLGHRERLRDRFRKGGADALGEYECPSSEYLGQKAAGFSGGRGSSDG
jgi:hypothetical protein